MQLLLRLRRLLPVAPFVLALAPKPTPTPAVRRVAVRYCEGTALPPAAFGESTNPARRGDVEIQSAPEGTPIPKGSEAVHICVLPASDVVTALVAGFPVTLQEHAFAFDGRTYGEPGDAILLADPKRPSETVVLGVTLEPAAMLAQRRIRGSESAAGDYVVVKGGADGLRKWGRFSASGDRLAVERAADKDEIAGRDAFFGSLVRMKKGVVTVESAPGDKAAAEKWLTVAAKLGAKKPFLVRVFPDAGRKATYTGSSRPADVLAEQGAVRVELDASAPASPDLATPALASAAAAAANPRLAERPILLQAIGAWRAGTWWGRDVKSFGAFALAAKVEPSIDEVLGDGQDVSSVLAVGAAASWLDAGARLESEAAVAKALAGKDADLVSALTRWRAIAWRQPVKPPSRRPLPDGFLAGVSYVMRNTLEESFISPVSAKALEGLRGLGANSVAVMPVAFASDEKSDRLTFVHRSPRSETDEAIVQVVADARAAGMTVMVKPRLEVGSDAALGRVDITGEEAWRDWFAAYRRFVVHHAVVAEAAGAAVFCAGDELSATEVREKEWRFVFAALRLATGAPLVYAAHNVARVLDITFWDALDAIGVDFFDPLGKGNERLSDGALEAGVRRAGGPLAQASRKYSNRPVILTEAGYPHVRAAWLAPADESSPLPYATDDAARCVAAVYRALGKEPFWRGVYWSKAFSDGDPARPGVKGFNFVGTPVERAIADGFRSLSSR